MKQDAIEQLLPEIFQQTLRSGGPLSEILGIMEIMQEPAEQALDHLEVYFSPYRAPDRFVPLLARWMDLDRFFSAHANKFEDPDRFVPPISTGMGRLRELINATIYLSQWRGTAKGLQLFLETATGACGFRIEDDVSDSDNLPRPFHIRVWAPALVVEHRPLIIRIIEQEKPAYVTYELIFDAKSKRGKND